MRMQLETGWGSLAKYGEELCGDNVEIVRTPDSVTAVLADGLGSGVKANILSKMTARIIATMLEKGAPIEEVVDTVSKTLPVCRKRMIAYSTFTILQVNRNGEIYIIEYDNPPVFYLCRGKVHQTGFRETVICGRKIKESRFRAGSGDMLVAVSDGVVHAGVGAVLNLGWQWENVGSFLARLTQEEDEDADGICRLLLHACNRLYEGKPGDDATAVAIRIRPSRMVTIAAGPPQDREDDLTMTRLLLGETGKKVICGGTTGSIIARFMGERIEADIDQLRADLPPTGYLSGIDLVTEGIITLSRALEYLKAARLSREEPPGENGAGELAQLLWESDEVLFLVGRAINLAHQNPDLPVVLPLKAQVVNEMAGVLRELGKEVEVFYF